MIFVVFTFHKGHVKNVTAIQPLDAVLFFKGENFVACHVMFSDSHRHPPNESFNSPVPTENCSRDVRENFIHLGYSPSCFRICTRH